MRACSAQELPEAGVEMKVGGSARRSRARFKQVGGRRVRLMRKLDEDKVRWIIREKIKGEMTGRKIAERMEISEIWVKKLWARYRHTKPAKIQYPETMGRPPKGLHGRREHSAVLSAHCDVSEGAGGVKKCVRDAEGTNIPHRTINSIMKESGDSVSDKAKTRQRKWVRYERKHSNSMWHTDYKLLDDGRWFIAYQDDASRFIVGFGVFKEATGEHAIDVLKEAISRHGKPASVLTDHGSQFYANEKEAAARGEAMFEKELVALGIRHILARVNHPQTNGKLERFHGDLQRKLPRFAGASVDKAVRQRKGSAVHVGGPFCTDKPRDPVERLVSWYNNKPHRSLDWDNSETPAQAFVRKAAPNDEAAAEDVESKGVL